jgi:ElaB/YqjD/DUF883 family membrane-anchored ribosome-binding protein
MNTVVEESNVKKSNEIEGCCAAARCGHEAAKRIEKGVNDVKAAKAAVSAKLEDSRMEAGRLLKKGRYAVEDGVSEATQTIKRHPAGTLAIAFAAGAALGFLAPRAAKK